MKRRLLTALVFLLLGAVVTVVVAWGCYAANRSITIWAADRPPKAWELVLWEQRTSGAPPPAIVSRFWMVQYDRTVMATYDVRVQLTGPLHALGIMDAGIPCRALRWHWYWSSAPSGPPPQPSAEGLLGVVPLGFAIDTLAYGALARLLWIGSTAMRARRRIRRGVCPGCTYPIGTSPVCTECGCELPARTRRVEV